MDPQVTLETIYAPNEHEASDAAESLRDWLLKGGYIPFPTGRLSRLDNALRRLDREGALAELSALISLDPSHSSPRNSTQNPLVPGKRAE